MCSDIEQAVGWIKKTIMDHLFFYLTLRRSIRPKPMNLQNVAIVLKVVHGQIHTYLTSF